MIPGITIAMGSRDWLVPPLTLGQLFKFMPRVQELTTTSPVGALGSEQLAVLVEIVTAALQRNYPEITADEVANLLDLGNARAVLAATLAAPDATITVAGSSDVQIGNGNVQ
jgi:hypothetical protein